MRLKMDVLKTVFYLGTKPPGAKFKPLGTAFLLGHHGAEHMIYLVTAKHVAEAFGDDPVNLRLNGRDGAAHDFFLDLLAPETEGKFKWFYHPEPRVDLAVMPFPVDLDKGEIDCLIINGAEVIDRAKSADSSPVGCGDLCYAVGLFSVAPGNKVNFPVIHTGNIARMSSREELIQQWSSGKIVDREGYLVQLSNLGGLSGAPVFIRSGYCIQFGNGEWGMVMREQVDLLGVWSGSWEGPRAGEPHMRVPVGMGIVVPSERLVELLNSEPVLQFIRSWLDQTTASKPDAAPAA
jgi:hypothetical protein